MGQVRVGVGVAALGVPPRYIIFRVATICFPMGARANTVIFRCCSPKGLPMMVRKSTSAVTPKQRKNVRSCPEQLWGQTGNSVVGVLPVFEQAGMDNPLNEHKTP